MKKILIVLFLFFANVCYAAQDVNVESLKLSCKTTVVTVGNTATALPATPLSGRKVITIQNLSTSVIYIGNSDITADENSTGGFQLANQYDTITIDATDNITIYGISVSGSVKVCVLEVR